MIHGTTQFWEDAPEVALTGVCRYCGEPIRADLVVCSQCLGRYIQMRKRAKRQVRQLVKLSRERRGKGERDAVKV